MIPVLNNQEVEYLEWCSFCKSAPSDGNLEFLIDDVTKETVEMPSCQPCALKQSWGYDVKGLNA